jgi:hypothetical protein
MRNTPAVLLALATSFALACQSQGSSGTVATPEVAEMQVKLDLPPTPTFDDPRPYADGTHSVSELRHHGAKFMDQDIKVKGYVVYHYDCAQALGPQVVKDTPERCDKPHFYLGDAPDAAPERSLWIVEVPRAPRADETERALGKEAFEAMKLAFAAVPPLAVGLKVTVDGKFASRSPKGFVNSEGLLVFASVVVTP